MKQHLFYRFSWCTFLAMCVTMVVWMACSKELSDDISSSLPCVPSTSECADTFADTLSLTDTLFWNGILNDPLPDSTGVGAADRAWPTLYTPSPLKGCPNSTFYIFRVYDGGVGPQISVKFTTPSGGIVYASMARSGVYQLHSRTLMQQGRYKIQYVWTSSKTPVNTQYWWIDNTAVTLNTSGLSHIVWPFGSDGSTNTNRLGWYMSCGHGCNTHTTQNGDYYAEDWNRSWNGNSNADYLHDFRSPLDGKVVNVEYRPSTYGHMVDIEQTVGTQRVWFRIAHLSSVSVQVGNIVYAGVTKIGSIGYSGNVSPSGSAGAHAHCVLYKVTSAGTNGGSIDFDFDAVCNWEIVKLSLLHICNATRSGISTPCFPD